MDLPLRGRVAVVTGASRGVGKGIALELGAAGATVYVTGRTVEQGSLPGTIVQTADEVTSLGGKGIPVVCDHRDDEQTEALFTRVNVERGRLDVLANNVFSAPGLARHVGRPFWELPGDIWDEVVGLGARAHYVASGFAAPLMVEGGLVVNVSSPGSVQYQQNVVYGVAKAALDKMTSDMAVELKPRGISVISLWPGLVRTEFLLASACKAEDGRLVLKFPDGRVFDIGHAETPRFVGRGVVGLALDKTALDRSGRAESTAVLAQRYGFTDIDGGLPPEDLLT